MLHRTIVRGADLIDGTVDSLKEALAHLKFAWFELRS